MLDIVLTDLGLDKKEIKIYIQLLKMGPSRASTVAYQVDMPRTSVQNIMNRLEHEKVVTRAIERGVYVFTAIHPDNLGNIAEIKKRHEIAKYDRIKDDLDRINPELLGIMKSSKNLPKVRFYQGQDAVRNVLYDTLGSKTEVKDIVNIDAMFKYAQEINDEYVAEREKSKVTKRSLLLDTPFAREIYESGTYSPKSHKGYKWINSSLYSFAVEMNIYDDKVSYITYVEESFVGVIIENEHIFQMHSALWDLHWGSLPEVKSSK